MRPQQAYDNLIKELREISLLGSVAGVLGWDERTQMPPKGAEHRAAQSSLLARMIHERFTSPRIGEWLSEIESSDLVRDRESDASVNVRQTRRAYDRAVKVPTALVEELTHTGVLGQQAWDVAKKSNDFPKFQPWLEKLIVLKRRQAQCIGSASGNLYDALLDEFEPGETAAAIRKAFDALRGPLVELVGKIAASRRKAPVEILERKFAAALQEKISRQAATLIGFDFQAGRLDVSSHPFCSGLGPGDTRMTTRYDEAYFGDAFFGVLHETGHGLYDQGLDPAHYGTPRGEAVSLGIHESQSRLWENLVGRSRSFWKFFFPTAKQLFSESLADIDLDRWYFAINDVRPSLIRTESDEVTYNLHIMLRFDLEQALLNGDLKAADLPGIWNQKMKDYLGVSPPDDTRGCLQDIHWSDGAFGYFPTYTLGNLYAAQFFSQATKDLGDLNEQFSRGEFAPLLGWLREKIHRHGQKYTAGELAIRTTGRPLEAAPLLSHLSKKAAELYGV